MSNPPPLPSRLPPKFPKPSAGANSSPASSKYSDAFGGSLESSTSSQSSRRPPVAPRKPHRPSELNGTSSTSSSVSPPPPIPPVAAARRRPVMEQQMSDSFSSQEGFGVCLQQCYEAITKKHEDELLALESLRGHIFNRARADKEYAESLNRMNQKANKKVQNINQSSAVVQAWLCFLEMSDNLQKQISCGAAQMSSVILNAVDQLIRDKRGAKSVFDQEQARLESEKKLSCTTVQDLRRNYRKHLTATEGYKGKLETALQRDPPKPAEQDKYRKKFVLHAERLHSCHNNYSLAVLNANVHQDYFQASLLPFTLDTLQHRMELNISQWKDAMMNYAKALDLTQTYQDSFQKLYDSLRCVEQEQEYVEFIRENKKDQIPVEHYEFDPVLLQNRVAPKVEPGKVVINNLTHNGIKTRLAGLENDLEQHARDIEQKEQDLKDLINSPDDRDGLSSPLTPSSPTKEPAQLPKHVRISNLQSQIKELVCLQGRKHVQADLIKEAVDGMYEPTPPLFDPLGEGVDVSDIETSVSSGTTGASATHKGGYKAKHAIGTLKHGLKGLFKAGKSGRSKSTSSSKHESDSGGITPGISQDMLDTADADSDTSSLGEYDMPPEIPVEEEEWYFGDIDRRLAESKCKKQGDYLVRYSERQNKYVLTCSWNGNSKHFVIQQVPNEKGEIQYRFESKTHATIKALLDYHVESGTPVTRQSGAKISTFVTKYDKWALSHSDITIGRKIGKGAFGDVFEASLKSTGERLAIKSCRSSDLTDMDKFLQEAEILKQYDHPNVVKLIGVCAQKDPVYIVMEFMPGGAFLDFLRKKGCNQTKKKLCGMCVNACQGMAYLESMHCIHRDLAARNCLVGDGDIVKISDFGMSREDEGGIYIVSSGTRQIPIKWTAPEALNYGKYTTSSDVWSFGILLWEAFSCGSAPYPGMSNHDARSQIEVGYRMPAPADCPTEVYGVMQQCWQYDPEERPDFSTILNMLQQAEQRVKT